MVLLHRIMILFAAITTSNITHSSKYGLYFYPLFEEIEKNVIIILKHKKMNIYDVEKNKETITLRTIYTPEDYQI